MKQFTLVSIAAVVVGTLLASSLGSDKNSSKKVLTPLLKEELKTAPKIYAPMFFNTITPTCPAIIVADTRYLAQAEDQGFIVTEHCTSCGLGALYEKENQKVCSYCEAVF